jgi:hypothetical protein
MDQRNSSVSKLRPRGERLPTRSERGLFRISLLFWLAIVQVLTPRVAVGQQDSAGEYELKAAMLYNLTRFVEWPPSAYTDAQAPTVLCLLGRDPFGDSLTKLAFHATASERPVQIRHIANDKEIRGCHVVYISSSERKSIAQIFPTLKGSNVLTVGEMAQFAARGGMIQFSLEEKQVRFEINLAAASEAELKISSRLLVLARIVKDPNKNPSREGSALRSQASRLPAPGRRGAKASLMAILRRLPFPAMPRKGFAGADKNESVLCSLDSAKVDGGHSDDRDLGGSVGEPGVRLLRAGQLPRDDDQ